VRSRYTSRKRLELMSQHDFELDRLLSYDDDALLSEIRRAADVLRGSALTQENFDKIARVHSSTIRKRFGGWRSALERAGLASRFVGAKRCRIYSNEAMISEMRRVAHSFGSCVISRRQFKSAGGRMNPETIARRFGNWETALKAAGLKPLQKSRPYTIDEYLDNILTVWTHYGRQPRYGEMDEFPSRISAGAYEFKFGTWRRALRAFMEKVNTGRRDSQSCETDGSAVAISQDTSAKHAQSQSGTEINESVLSKQDRKFRHKVTRALSLGMRYDVLRRDRFRCVRCGRSPATDSTCQLHVDHKLPCSMGGETVMSNLRTLCAECNLGKGAKIE
jgi:5-methylcytosine-specific restriction endonuclease McrA